MNTREVSETAVTHGGPYGLTACQNSTQIAKVRKIYQGLSINRPEYEAENLLAVYRKYESQNGEAIMAF